MKVHLIKAFSESKFASEKDEIIQFVELLENIQNSFGAHWALDTEDFGLCYDKSLESSISRRLWKDHDYYPKEAMLELINQDVAFVRSMFRNLFSTEKDLNSRVSKFLFCCDALMEDHKKVDGKFRDHYHADCSIISLYLSLNQEEVAYAKQSQIEQFNVLVESRQPTDVSLQRNLIITKVMTTILAKDDQVLAFKRRLDNDLGRPSSWRFWVSALLSRA